MHSRRAASFLLGLWMGGALVMAWVSFDNLRAANRMLTQPDPVVRTLLLSRTIAQNRRLVQDWGAVQLTLGVGLFLFLLLGTREGKVSLLLVLGMLAVQLLQIFLAPLPNSGVIGEGLKWTLGLILGFRLLHRRRRSGDVREDVDLVDKANHRHVNG